MTSDTEERKHRRTSDDESEEPSKRHKHRHHHRRRHHRHHSRKHDDIREEEDDEQITDMPPPSLPPLPVNRTVEYDMEEGEIVEEDGGDVVVKKVADSDAESGEIGEIETGKHGDTVEFNHSLSLPLDDESNGSKTKEHNDNGHTRIESKKGSSNRKSHYDDDYETRDRKKPNEDYMKARKDSPSKHTHERRREEDTTTSRSRSHDHSRARSRSRSQSISRGASRLEKHEDVEHYRSKKSSGNSDDERATARMKDYRHGSRDVVRDKERERSSSRSRHSLDTRDADRDRYRERDLREFERERMRKEREREADRERERGMRERDRERDMRERDRERDMRERDRERERDMRDRERGRERERGRRDRERGVDSERENSRNRRSYNYNDGDRDRSNDYKHHRHEETDYRDKSRKYDRQKDDSSKAVDADAEKIKREEVDEEAYQDKSALQVEEDDEEEDLNRIKEESRRRIQAILEKYKTKPMQQQQQPLPPQLVDEAKENVEESVGAANVNSRDLDGQGEGSDTNIGDTPFSVGRSPPQNGNSGVQRASGAGGLGEGTPKSERSNGDDIFGESPPRAREMNERSNDMFSDDIFGESPAGVRKSGKGDGLTVQRSGLQDNWDDAEGYYSYRFGEILDGRYEVIAAHGKGVFSTVVRAKDLKAGSNDPEEVAIKIIRNNDKMYKAGLEELVILKKLVGADLEDRRHCVRFLSSFKYRNHLCLVFESLHMNLREVLKKFGRNIGLKLTAVRAYGKQLFIALKHLRNCGVLHTDIKPDNMLVNDAKNVLKLCDFGNAMFAGKNEITPYLVSRFYRAPEIILGLTYDHPVDMWSVGCCLFELYTGKVLFPGATNNDMLRLHMELKGSFPKKMLRKGAFTELHFDQDLNFVAIEEDPVTKKTVKRLVNMKAKDIGSIVTGSPGEDPKMLANFKDLLEKIFILDPDKRLTVQQALSHPFITGK
ncbi:putative protein kinase CMGC-DYRK-PRP4 family [Helianthus annuus]|uniref:Serine/threonine-protein kinase PRP4 homolog n=1 Tax=Helianthus annuus TaxID=4232 RepID=A0A251U3A1_HELAN|nr:putative protein kinase CMGC-DYRK-PRP4 family [Helianthus annuus]KAJ0721360.1 putative protein kinase CMGC-DYRK-PRP4 family [Helianthus annuus]